VNRPSERDDTVGNRIESELTAAMNDFAESIPAPCYDPSALIAARRRRRPQLWALAAVVVAVAAVGTGVAVLSGGGGSPRQVVPASPSASHSAGARTTAPVAGPTGPSSSPAVDPMTAQTDATRTVVTAAEMYENPATRGRVDLAAVAAEFTGHAAFVKAWGDGGRGVTCGTVVDGALAAGPVDVDLYRAQRGVGYTVVHFDGVAGKVAGVTCGTGMHDIGDPVMAAVYGGVVSGGKSGDGLVGPRVDSATCGQDRAKTWYADDPASGTVVEGWMTRLDGGRAFTTVIATDGHDAGMLTGVNCRPEHVS
jgi:hypothetical protein